MLLYERVQERNQKQRRDETKLKTNKGTCLLKSGLFTLGEIPIFWSFCFQWEWGLTIFTFPLKRKMIKRVFWKNRTCPKQLCCQIHQLFWGAYSQILQSPDPSPGKMFGPFFWPGGLPNPALPPPRVMSPIPLLWVLSVFAHLRGDTSPPQTTLAARQVVQTSDRFRKS